MSDGAIKTGAASGSVTDGDVAPRYPSLAAGRVRARVRPLDRPLTSYYLVLGITVLLLALGLVMVLSTSSAQSLAQGGSPYAGFQKQLVGVVVGLPLMWIAAKSSPVLFRAAAYPMVAVSLLGLLLVLAVGHTVGGAQRWIQIAGFQIQPSEFAKLAFVLWGADLLARKEQARQLTEWRHLLIPLLPGAAIVSMLVMLGDDLGTTFILLVIFLTLLWVIGTPGRLFIGMLGLMGFAMVILIIVASYRLQRITGFFHPQAQASTAGYQEIHGINAVGSGGWFGVGLGAGKLKWGWVPNATTDFIFAIIGEELGLVGTLCVTFLYGGLAYAGLRIAGGGHRVDSRSGPGEHRRGHRAPADHRRAAAAGLGRPVLAAGDPGRARHADVVRETGARSQPGTRRCWPRTGAARPKLAWPRYRRLPRAARLSPVPGG